MADDLERTVSCSHCGGAALYAGMIGMPANAIYQCNGCGRSTWVPRRPFAGGAGTTFTQQQQPQPDDPDDEIG